MPTDTPSPTSGPITSKRFDELTASEVHAFLELRCLVFVVEQQCVYNDVDGRDDDSSTVHHWIELDGRMAAYARELHAGNASSIGRVVTHPDFRGMKLAADLVDHIAGRTLGPLSLEAQSHLVDWYRARGFEVHGDEYVEDGIPHRHMRRA